ncbi:hypothetical protein [Motilibacter rhizosphaerae]|uniref:hypothetical protein n=1 Tax=Motilibacter rhizosphaerae TaxID=598652 RepID=UPI001E58D920|nr:hypothetical protein [Motilibacter rhizosphaerae]
MISSDELRDFVYPGERLPILDAQRGIRKPAALSAALSIRTVYRPEGAARPYEDAEGADGLIRYEWRGDDPEHPENRALRSAMTQGLPLSWFFGVGPGVYKPIFPVHLLWEEPQDQQFVLSVGDDLADLRQSDSPTEAYLRRTSPVRRNGVSTNPSSARR